MVQGATFGAQSKHGPQAAADLKYFADELARARRQVAQLEEEYRRAAEAARIAQASAPPLDESPRLARACNAAIWTVVATPFAIAAAALLNRLFG